MPEPASIETIRAACDTILPAGQDFPGAVAQGAERHVVDLIEASLPGLVDLVAALFDAYAADHGGRFVDLDTEGRGAVIRAMSSDESQDIRDAVDAVVVFTLGGTCSEWSAYDRAEHTLGAPPPAWAWGGFHGPSVAHPDFRDGL